MVLNVRPTIVVEWIVGQMVSMTRRNQASELLRAAARMRLEREAAAMGETSYAVGPSRPALRLDDFRPVAGDLNLIIQLIVAHRA